MQLERVGELTKGQLAIKPALNQFNGGEISPHLEGRFDWDKYAYSAKVCKNFIPQIEGGLKRRGGSHFVSLSRQPKTLNFYIKVNYSDNPSIIPTTKVDLGQNGSLTYTEQSFFVVEPKFPFSAVEGTTIEYSVYSEGYGTARGSFNVEEDGFIQEVNLIKLEDGANLKITTDPDGAEVTINGIKTNELFVAKDTDIDVVVKFGDTVTYKTVNISEDSTIRITIFQRVFESMKAGVSYITLEDAWYDVIIVGGGAGGGGGSWKDDHKTCGGGGGSGACFIGAIRLGGRVAVQIGKGGVGGASGELIAGKGGQGGVSHIGNYIIAGGGYAGTTGTGDVVTYFQGTGGVLKINSETKDVEISKNGNGDPTIRTGTGARSDYKWYGKGGDGQWKAKGLSGKDGYVKIVYKGE